MGQRIRSTCPWGRPSAHHRARKLTAAPIFWVTWLADSVLLAALGLILGIGTMKTFVKDPTAQAKLDETLAKLAPHQGRLGLAGIGVGVWMIVASILFHV